MPLTNGLILWIDLQKEHLQMASRGAQKVKRSICFVPLSAGVTGCPLQKLINFLVASIQTATFGVSKKGNGGHPVVGESYPKNRWFPFVPVQAHFWGYPSPQRVEHAQMTKRSKPGPNRFTCEVRMLHLHLHLSVAIHLLLGS